MKKNPRNKPLSSDLDILIPVKNEADNIQPLIERIDKSCRKANISYRAIFVDDHSTDKTQSIIRELAVVYPITLLIKKGAPGKATSILEASQAATSEFVVMIDGDLQYPPEAIPEMFKLTTQHGVVVARRIIYEGSFLRRQGSKMVSWFCGNFLHGITCDIQSGLKLFRRSLLEHIPAESISPWALDLPLLHTALEMGFSIGEIEITFEKRQHGSSKLSLFKPTLEISLGALRLKFKPATTTSIPPTRENDMIGAGVIHKRRRFITHSTLSHRDTALVTFSKAQKRLIAVLLFTILLGILLYPLETAIIVVGFLSFVYFVDVLFNFFLILKSLHSPPELNFELRDLAEIKDSELPVYTILCPLYREAHVLPGFIEAIAKLDWPKHKLDVLLLFEEDDIETIEAVKHMPIPEYFRVVVVPDSQPKTKPKACNYGLNFAKGEYVVIYDAEDAPDPLQLKKAYLGFKSVGPQVKCLQAKLNYYNPEQNWLTRFFTAEYSLWFDVILTGLQSIETSIPLGGTSNHFRTRDLIELQGWDPFNVTEDCDLGIRLFKKGYRTAIINSTTLEEANSNFKNWLRQRSRWIKGYMQTYLIHMRNPIQFAKHQGWHAALFQLTVGGKLAFILINPILWVLTVSYFALYAYVGPAIEQLYPSIVFYMAVTSLIFGNFMFVYYYMIGCAKREHWWLIKWVYLIPIYWLMVSIAGFIAFYQLLVKPHYWEKTIHGLHLKKQQAQKAATEVVKEIVAETAAQAEIATKQPTRPFTLRFNNTQALYQKIGNLRLNLTRLSLTKTLSLLKQPLYAGGLIFMVTTMIANVMNMSTNIVLGRLIGLEDFGIFNLIISLVYFVSIPISALGNSINYKTGYLLGKHDLKTIYNFWLYIKHRALWLAVGFSFIWLALTPFIAETLNTSYLPVLTLFPTIIATVALAVDVGYLTGLMLFGHLAIIVVLQPFIRLSSAVILAFIDPALTYLSVMISVVITTLVARSLIPRQADSFDQPHEYHLSRSYFMASLIAGTSAIAFFSLDNVLLATFISTEELGLYSLMGLFGKMIFFIGTLSATFLSPLVSRLEGAGKNSRNVFKVTFFLVVLTTIFSYVFFIFGLAPISEAILNKPVNTILPILPSYGLGVACFTIAQVIVAYHLIKKDYAFPYLAIGLAVIQILALTLSPHTLESAVTTMTLIGLLHLVVFGVLHLIWHKIYAPLRNLQDLRDLLFGFLPLARKPRNQSGKRVLIFNWRDIKHVWAGGAEAYVHQMAKQLVADGYQVTIFSGNDGHSTRYETLEGVQIIRRGGFYTVYIWAFLYYMLRLRNRFDLIIDSENGIPFLTPLYVNKPIILLIHHIHQEVFRKHLPLPLALIAEFIELTLMPLLYRDKTVITVSPSSRRAISKLGITSPQNLFVISPGIVPPPTPIKPKKTLQPSLCYVGRLKPYKNLDIVIKALPKLLKKFPNLSLTIAGTGESKSELERLAKTLKVDSAITFVGRITEQEKYEIFASSWLAIQPSMIEGWGITVIEANSLGTPVLASNVPGLRDSVVDTETGVLFQPENEKQFIALCTGLLRNTVVRKKLSKNAQQWATDFTWPNSAQKLRQIIEQQTVSATSSQTTPAYRLPK